MPQLLKLIHDVGTRAWLRFVQALNWIAVTFGALIIAVNTMFPKAIEDFAGALPPSTKLIVLAIWAGLVHYSLRRAKVSPND